MIKLSRSLFAAAALSLLPSLQADELKTEDVNAEALGFWHWDFTALRQSTLGKEFTAQIDLDRASINLQCPIRMVAGIDMRKDVLGSTVVVMGPRDGYAVLNGSFNQEAIVQAISSKLGAATAGQAGDVATWVWTIKNEAAGSGNEAKPESCPMPLRGKWHGCRGGELHLAFVKGKLLASFNAASLTKGVDTVSGKSAAIAADAPLVGSVRKDLGSTFLSGAFAAAPQELHKLHPMIAKYGGGSFAVGEKDGNFVASGNADMTDDATAQQILTMANGFLAMGQMHAQQRPECAEMLKGLKFGSEGKLVNGEFTMPVAELIAKMKAGFTLRREKMAAKAP
ncbi:MAG: hypothetical protein RL095_1412 [Verrucomicrobiota bacterium]|jgi:hypothetical protein